MVDSGKIDSSPANESLQAEASKSYERHKTTRFIAGGIFAVIGLGLILWAIVIIKSSPPWLVVLLAIFGPTGTITVCFGLYLRFIIKKNQGIDKRIDDVASGSEKKDGGSNV